MIFAQYKHAITFAVVILGLAVVVADPGNGDSSDTPAAPQLPAEHDASLAAPGQNTPASLAPDSLAPASADPAWYGDDTAAAAEEPAEPAGAAEAGAGYNLSPAPPRTPAAAEAPGYVPPPPPPQVPPSR